MLITLEGPEGGGKSTLALALQARLRERGIEPVMTFEPGGTALGLRLREIVRHGIPSPKNRGEARQNSGQSDTIAPEEPIGPLAETLLFCAARAQLLENVIRPALARGRVVICDRYADSTIAYQCAGRGLDEGEVRSVIRFATGGLTPDLTALLDLAPEVGLRRKEAGEEKLDRFEIEGAPFHHRVRRGYLELASREPDRWLVVDASQVPEEIARQVWAEVETRLALSLGSK